MLLRILSKPATHMTLSTPGPKTLMPMCPFTIRCLSKSVHGIHRTDDNIGCRLGDTLKDLSKSAVMVALETSWVDGFAERVVADVELLSDLRFGVTAVQQLLRTLDDLGRHHRRRTNSTRFEEALDTFFAILLDTPQNATLGDPKGADDLRLLAGTLVAQLGGEHAKRWQIVLGMLKHRDSAAEIGPFSVPLHDADQITDAGSILSNQWQ